MPLASAVGVGGASTLAARRSGFDTLATVVAATTLLMAGVSLCKLLPKRRPDQAPLGRRPSPHVSVGPRLPDRWGVPRSPAPGAFETARGAKAADATT